MFLARVRVTLTSLINFGGKKIHNGRRKRRFSLKYGNVITVKTVRPPIVKMLVIAFLTDKTSW